MTAPLRQNAKGAGEAAPRGATPSKPSKRSFGASDMLFGNSTGYQCQELGLSVSIF
jgi:hypothetical protein